MVVVASYHNAKYIPTRIKACIASECTHDSKLSPTCYVADRKIIMVIVLVWVLAFTHVLWSDKRFKYHILHFTPFTRQ